MENQVSRGLQITATFSPAVTRADALDTALAVMKNRTKLPVLMQMNISSQH